MQKREKKPKKKKSEIKVRKISPDEFSKKSSGLEEDVEEEPEFSAEQFREFIRAPSFEAETPVLKKTGNIPEPTNLEQNLESAPVPATRKEEDAIKYKMISEDYEAVAQRARQMQSEDLIIHQPLKTRRLEEERINLTRMQKQNFQFNPELQEMRRHSEENLEKNYVTNIKGEFEKKKTHSPFEQQEKKYEIR